LAPIARKLSSAFAGQGSSERLNKDVANTRTAVRNKQTVEVTKARLEIKYAVRLHYQREGGRTLRKPFLLAMWDEATAMVVEPAAVTPSETEEEEEEEIEDPQAITSMAQILSGEVTREMGS